MSTHVTMFNSPAAKVDASVEEAIGGDFDLKKLVENFDLLADATGAVKQLGSLILDLAVRGRLVPQSPAEEAVDALIPKKRANGVEISGPVPFDLPRSWMWTTIGGLGTTQTGVTPTAIRGTTGTIPFIRPGNISDAGEIDYGNEFLDEKALAEHGRLAAANSVLMVCIGTVGKCTSITRTCSFNQQINSVSPSDGILAPLVAYFMRSRWLQREALARSSETTITILNKGRWSSIPFPLPPLAEQKRIVARVDELMRLLDDLEAKQAKKREIQARLRTAAFDALTSAEGPEKFEAAWKRVAENFAVMFEQAGSVNDLRRGILELGVRGHLAVVEPNDEPVAVLCMRIERERRDLLHGRRVGARGRHVDDSKARPEPYLIPRTWSWCVLEDVAGHIVDGTHHTPKYVEKGCDFISAKDIRKGAIIFEGCRQITTSEFDGLRKRCSPKRDHVLVTKSGSIGEVAVVGTDRTFTLFESVALVPVVPSVNSRYAAFVIHLGASGQFGAIHRKGIGVPHLHLVDLRRLPFPLPSRQVQDRIVARVEQLLTLCDDLEANLRRSEDSAAKLVEAVVAEITATGCV